MVILYIRKVWDDRRRVFVESGLLRWWWCRCRSRMVVVVVGVGVMLLLLFVMLVDDDLYTTNRRRWSWGCGRLCEHGNCFKVVLEWFKVRATICSYVRWCQSTPKKMTGPTGGCRC